MSAWDLDDASDRILAGRAGNGDIDAFEVLIRRYSPLLRSCSRHILGSADESDDVVQQAMITSWQQIPTLADPGAVKPWLMRIVIRKCLDQIRARHPAESIDDEATLVADASGAPDAVAGHRALQSALAAALAGLPDSQHRCWVMKEVAGYSYDDIAKELELPVSTVRGLLSRARKTLIREMDPWR